MFLQNCIWQYHLPMWRPSYLGSNVFNQYHCCVTNMFQWCNTYRALITPNECGKGFERKHITFEHFIYPCIHGHQVWVRLLILFLTYEAQCGAVITRCTQSSQNTFNSYPDSKVHGANMGPTWVLSAPDGPHVGFMNLAIGVWYV